MESQDAQRVAVLLAYLFDGDRLRECAREDWLKHYDTQAGGGAPWLGFERGSRAGSIPCSILHV